jgi:hypothetical protein
MAGSRFYLSYSGSAPSGANCTTLASDIAAAWQANFPGTLPSTWALTEVDVLDIATDSGLSGQWTGSHPGTRSGTPLPSQCASNVEFGLARRYRGGKPRMYVPPGCTGDQQDAGHWESAYVALFTASVSQMMTAIEALSVGSMGTLAHVNLSYYKGFTNITNSSGRERAVPTYRSAALVDTVTGYSGKAEISSQKRRRVATSP